MRKSISVVIPNYNGEQLLQKNLPLLYEALNTANLEYEIIIPDDASTDNSILFLKNNYPAIILVQNKINGGFSTNINSGIRQATKELVFLLNSDIELTPDYFSTLLPYFQDSTIFGVTGRIIGIDSDIIQDGAKYPQYSFANIKSTVNYIPENEVAAIDKIPTFFLAGSNALIDLKKLNELGGFSELYSPFYSEDVDLGLRAWRLGYTCFYEHQAICRHPNAATIKKYNSRKKVNTIAKRNKFYLHYIHLNGLELYVWFFLLLLKTFGRLLVLDQKYWQSARQFFKKLSTARQTKLHFAQLQKEKQVNLSVREIYNLINTQIATYKIRKF